MKKIAIVCVNYNSYNKLTDYLLSLDKALKKTNEIQLTVYVADNSTRKKEIPNSFNYELKVYRYENIGYFGGAFEIINNIEDKEKYSFIIISNVDLTVDETFFLDMISLKTNESCAWVAPRIYSLLDQSEKKYALKKNRIPKYKLKILIFMFSHPVIMNIYRKTIFKKKKKDNCVKTNSDIYCGHGSFIILTSKFFQTIKVPIIYPCFLYGEELFLGEIIRENKMVVEYHPEICINDSEHVSTSQMTIRKNFNYNKDSLKYIYKTFYIKKGK